MFFNFTGTAFYLQHCHASQNNSLATGDNISGNVLIDPSAKTGKKCKIGPNVVSLIIHFCYIFEYQVIGPRVVIEDGVCLKDCTILADSIVKNYTWITQCIIGR